LTVGSLRKPKTPAQAPEPTEPTEPDLSAP
jgi:hypothetical protein